ncbi:MAG: twin-arginine translocase subunit TatB [Alphaproteobacteria bacterium]|nr:twin-arginine translocase subunit TatB [Alphaproteobacteria bacterium]
MPEMFVVLVLALVVVGPQQLPILMRRVGRMIGQMRAMAKEFQASFDEIGRETELSELRKEIEALKQANPLEEVRGAVDQAALDAQNQKIRDLKIKQAGGPAGNVERPMPPENRSPQIETIQPRRAADDE